MNRLQNSESDINLDGKRMSMPRESKLDHNQPTLGMNGFNKELFERQLISQNQPLG